MKVYTHDDLCRFCERAAQGDNIGEKAETARRFIGSRPYLSESEKADLLDYLDYCLIPNDYHEDLFHSSYEKDYGPSNPWDAPGMKVSDFITGVKFW